MTDKLLWAGKTYNVVVIIKFLVERGLGPLIQLEIITILNQSY